jgi:hypothetical protein
MNYYYPEIGSQSKAIWVLDAIAKNDKKTQISRDMTINNSPGVFWGLARQNFDLIKEYQNLNKQFYFTDMPYWNRYMGNNRDTCSWRIIPNSLHCNWVEDYPNDRFKKLNITVKEWRKTGDHILVCPSSNTINRFYNQNNWLNDTLAELKKYTDRPIKIRNKPRNSKTSGPLAALTTFEEDVKNAWAVVTLVSIAGVEAACLGIPVFCNLASPVATLGNTNIANIESPLLNDRTKCLNTLAYYQYTENELKAGMCKIINDTFLSK